MKLFSKNYSHYNDEDLMRFFIKGDKKAFEQIYARYESFVVNFFTDDCGMIRKKQRILRMICLQRSLTNQILLIRVERLKHGCFQWQITCVKTSIKNKR